MTKRWILLCALLVGTMAGAIGCGGKQATAQPAGATATPTASAIPTREPIQTPTQQPATPLPLPPKPADLSQYAPTISAFLDQADASIPPCDSLRPLFQNWGLAWDEASPPCIVGNTDDDEQDEIVVLFETTDPSLQQRRVAVFDPSGGLLKTAFESGAMPTGDAGRKPASRYSSLLATSTGMARGKSPFFRPNAGPAPVSLPSMF